MIWNILYEAGAIGLNNGHFPTQAREPPVGEGFGTNLNQAPEGGNDLSPSERRMTIGMNSDSWQNPNAL